MPTATGNSCSVARTIASAVLAGSSHTLILEHECMRFSLKRDGHGGDLNICYVLSRNGPWRRCCGALKRLPDKAQQYRYLLARERRVNSY
jgi:hypothetical protein